MRKDNWFVVLLVALCLALAAMAAVSSTPSGEGKPDFAGVGSPDEVTVTGNLNRSFPTRHEGGKRTVDMQHTR